MKHYRVSYEIYGTTEVEADSEADAKSEAYDNIDSALECSEDLYLGADIHIEDAEELPPEEWEENMSKEQLAIRALRRAGIIDEHFTEEMLIEVITQVNKEAKEKEEKEKASGNNQKTG